MYAIQLISDPKRRLTSASMSGVNFNLGKGFLEFATMEEAEALRSRYVKWYWGGTEIVPV